MSTIAKLYLPDGQNVTLPIDPHTWVDKSATVPGEALRARYLESDAGGTTAWIRQRPNFVGFASLAQSIPVSTWTAITGLTELIDNWSGHSDTTNTGRWYAPFTNADNGAGQSDWYLCIGNIPMAGQSPTNAHIAGFRVNGSTIYEGAKFPGNASHGITPGIVDLVQLSGVSNEYIELAAFHNEASAFNTVVSSKAPNLQVRWACMSNNGFITAFTPAVPAAPHTWTATDVLTGSATGGAKVALNTELRDTVRFLNNPPCFRVHASGTAQTLPAGAGTWTPITFTAESLDPYGMWTSGATVTCQRAGLYYVACLGAVTETATKAGYRAVRIHHTIAAGGSADYYGTSIQAGTGTATTGTTMLASAHIRMAAGDTLQMQYDHTNGSALPVLGTSATNSARMIGVWEAK
jgi:hypothetical protein